ncbi:MAG: phosphoenolpyruvate carboxykinase (ATP), partial [Acidobacteria bacterium]|nr:phosphoenolpyruvate carboxykinase (ATP) [Acidobacteriota bacterium]NIT10648.1 phosphoenolpyruvate carboxykinase (ATP) [Acidobacteriota bacterium]
DVGWGTVNQEIPPQTFDALYERVTAHLGGKRLFVQDLWGGADPAHRISVRLVTESPWAALFARNLLI